MESKTLFEVLARMLGLYFSAAAIISLPSLLDDSFMPSIYWMGVLLHAAIGLVLLTRADLVTRFAYRWAA